MKFSSRHRFDPRQPKGPIEEDAPEWVRATYLTEILAPLLYIDGDSRYSNDDGAPLGAKELHADFCACIRESTEESYFDSWYCMDELRDHVKSCPWFQFYDFVELVASKLPSGEDDPLRWEERFTSEDYRRRVNDLFSSEQVVWRLNRHGHLVRELPGILQQTLTSVTTRLDDGFEAARQHYRKAHSYLYARPEDPENAIKEIVSALESVARTLSPKSSTLGQALKKLADERLVSPELGKVLERFWGYASAEPAVRHGGPVPSRVSVADAEMAFHIAVAAIRYLLERGRAR